MWVRQAAFVSFLLVHKFCTPSVTQYVSYFDSAQVLKNVKESELEMKCIVRSITKNSNSEVGQLIRDGPKWKTGTQNGGLRESN